MKLENLISTPERKVTKRVGRGPGSGMGKTSTRGENGQKSRSGASIPALFQGWQSPLYRRLPKRGFNNKFATVYAIINVSDLNKFEDGATVNLEALINAGIIPLTFANEADYDRIDQMDELKFADLHNAILTADEMTVTNTTKGFDFKVKLDLSTRQREMLKAGGLLNYTRENGKDA